MSITNYNRDEIDAHIREQIEPMFHSTFVQSNPFVYLMGLRTTEEMGKLGSPTTGAILGDANMTTAQRMEAKANLRIVHRMQSSEDEDADTLDYQSATTPVASENGEDNGFTFGFAYTRVKQPMKIGTDALNFAKSDSEIGSLVDEVTSAKFNALLKKANTLLAFGGTNGNGSAKDMNSATEQAKGLFRENLGIRYTLTADNIYAGRDRSATPGSLLNPQAITATDFPNGSIADLNIARWVNFGFTKSSDSSDFVGMSTKNPNSMGCKVFLTTSAILQKLLDDADARGIDIHTNGLEGHRVTGVKFPIIDYGGCFYTFANNVPSGEMWGLDLDQWIVDVARGGNFTFSGLTNKPSTEEGGGEYEWGNFEFMFRQRCMRPDLQVLITGLTTG